jgi:8-oxo-dGTP pyrophosphatase MutT (NUDIX family)
MALPGPAAILFAQAVLLVGEDKVVDRTLHGVDAVVFWERKSVVKVLMLRRSVPDEAFRTGWEYVKGAVKEDETYSEAAEREVREETGLTPLLVAELEGEMTIDARHRRRPHYDFVKKRAFVFLHTGGQVTLDPDEHDDWAWMDFEQACRCIWVEGGQEILAESLKVLQSRQETVP